MLGYPVVISSEYCFSCADAHKSDIAIAQTIIKIRFIVTGFIVWPLRCRKRIDCDTHIPIYVCKDMQFDLELQDVRSLG